MCGTPQRSRTTRTGADRPSSPNVPDGCAASGRGSRSAARPHAIVVRVSAMQKSAGARGRIRLSPMAIKDGLLAEFDHEMGTTRKLLDRIPDDRLSWKPHEKSMSLGGLATHLANLPTWGGTI